MNAYVKRSDYWRLPRLHRRGVSIGSSGSRADRRKGIRKNVFPCDVSRGGVVPRIGRASTRLAAALVLTARLGRPVYSIQIVEDEDGFYLPEGFGP